VRKSYDRTKILDFIRRFIEQRGLAPTVGEIQRSLNISSKSVVDRHLKALEEEGHIKRTAGTTRGIEVSGMGKRSHTVPLLGTIAAGWPIPVPTEETWHTAVYETVEVSAEMLPRDIQAYALRVDGNSMVDAYVDDGDIVILEATPAAENGEMVAAWLTDRKEATLKRIYYEPERIRLQPANRRVAPIYVEPDKLEVQGRVIAVLRKYSSGTPSGK